MIVAQKAEFAQSYIAQARSSGRVQAQPPQQRASPGPASAQPRSLTGRSLSQPAPPRTRRWTVGKLSQRAGRASSRAQDQRQVLLQDAVDGGVEPARLAAGERHADAPRLPEAAAVVHLHADHVLAGRDVEHAR